MCKNDVVYVHLAQAVVVVLKRNVNLFRVCFTKD
jgi:hypothetical protein